MLVFIKCFGLAHRTSNFSSREECTDNLLIGDGVIRSKV